MSEISETEVKHVIREVKGLYGFRYKDQDKITLCSREAMPEGIGEWLFLFMSKLLNSEQKEELLEVFKENVENIKMVRPETSITDDDRKYLEVFHDEFGLSDKENIKAKHWATFFGLEEGNLDMYLGGFKYMINCNYMMLLSKEFSYAYIINFDDNTFEVYQGNTEEPYSNEQNRYSDKQHEFLGSGYYGMKLITAISFDDIVDGINLLDFL